VIKNIIDLRNVWKTYQMGHTELNALQGIDLKIKKGEFLAILGKSGSGKSTMMNLVGCLDTPTRGEVFLDGVSVNSLSESELAQIRGKKIGFIFQQFNLVQNLTALENVSLPGEFQSEDNEFLLKRAEELLRFVEIEDRKDHRPSELSGGQMQRVAIARSLINNPEIVLADEPTGALDSKTGNMVMKMLQDLHKKENKSIVIVTHDSSLIKYATRVIELKDGKIIKEYKRK
jgi:putative ABC transport system ATP-binding protein